MKKLLMFSATWCGPCKAMKPIVANLDSEILVEIIDIDSEEHQDIVKSHNIMSVPTFVSFIDNEIKDRKVGFMSLQTLNDMFN